MQPLEHAQILCVDIVLLTLFGICCRKVGLDANIVTKVCTTSLPCVMTLYFTTIRRIWLVGVVAIANVPRAIVHCSRVIRNYHTSTTIIRVYLVFEALWCVKSDLRIFRRFQNSCFWWLALLCFGWAWNIFISAIDLLVLWLFRLFVFCHFNYESDLIEIQILFFK